MHFITLFPDMMEVESCALPAAAGGGARRPLATKREFRFHLCTCVLPREDRRGGQNNQTQVVVFKALIFGMRQTLKIVNI